MKKWYDIGLRYLVIGVEAVKTDKLKELNKKSRSRTERPVSEDPARHRHLRDPAPADLAGHDCSGFR